MRWPNRGGAARTRQTRRFGLFPFNANDVGGGVGLVRGSGGCIPGLGCGEEIGLGSLLAAAPNAFRAADALGCDCVIHQGRWE